MEIAKLNNEIESPDLLEQQFSMLLKLFVAISFFSRYTK